jgi:uracil-DNA glycosylase
MSEREPGTFEQRAAHIRAIHEARARAELDAADREVAGADAIASSGDLLAEVMLVKGMPGPAEAAGGAALSGADGAALDKALEALGRAPEHAFRTIARPIPGGADDGYAKRLRRQIEAIDPRVVVALDARAASDVSAALGCEALVPGAAITVAGRTVLAVDDFEASLADERRKRAAWSQLKGAKPPGPVF